jgi:hypothetical protein
MRLIVVPIVAAQAAVHESRPSRLRSRSNSSSRPPHCEYEQLRILNRRKAETTAMPSRSPVPFMKMLTQVVPADKKCQP